jgi:hypothetical protein
MIMYLPENKYLLFCVNMLLPFLAVYLTPYLNNLFYYIKDFNFVSFKSYNCIDLSGTITEDKHDIVTKFSKKMRALIYYVNKNCLINDVKLKRLIEISIKPVHCSFSIDFETEYLVDQNIPIALSKDLWCKIKVSSEKLFGEKQTTKIRTVKISVYSHTKSVAFIKNFVEHVQDEYQSYIDDKMHNNKFFFLYTKDHDDGTPRFSTTKFISNKTFGNLVFKGKHDMKKRIDFFLNNKSFYDKLGIPYTLGMLLYGPPGTGKTSSIKAIANYTDRHIIVIPMTKIKKFSTLRNIIMNDMIDDFNIPHSKRLYVFEEIDCNGLEKVIKKRSNDVKEELLLEYISKQNETKNQQTAVPIPTALNQNVQDDKITLGSLLELIDGINEASGRILIMTTNEYPTQFDDALMRPGRIDMKIQFSKCSHEEIEELFKLWFGVSVKQKLLKQIPEGKYSPAELGEIFINNIDAPDQIVNTLIECN